MSMRKSPVGAENRECRLLVHHIRRFRKFWRPGRHTRTFDRVLRCSSSCRLFRLSQIPLFVPLPIPEPQSSPANMSIVQPMSHTTANWHWKNKNIGSWAKQWFQHELTAITISGDGDESIRVVEVTEVDGDVEVGQRKSKYVTVSSLPPFISGGATPSTGAHLTCPFLPLPPSCTG